MFGSNKINICTCTVVYIAQIDCIPFYATGKSPLFWWQGCTKNGVDFRDVTGSRLSSFASIKKSVLQVDSTTQLFFGMRKNILTLNPNSPCILNLRLNISFEPII